MTMIHPARWAAAAMLLVLAAGNAAHAETRRVNDVSRLSDIDIEGRFKVEIIPGEQAGATLAGEPDDLARLGVRYRDGKLRIWEKCRFACGGDDLDVIVRITAPELNEIELARGVEATASGLRVQALSVDVAMGASFRASGQCEMLKADVAMGGELSAEDLACRTVSVDAAMGGAAAVRASTEAKADASMGGAITIHGSPPRIDSSTAMGGTISTAD